LNWATFDAMAALQHPVHSGNHGIALCTTTVHARMHVRCLMQMEWDGMFRERQWHFAFSALQPRAVVDGMPQHDDALHVCERLNLGGRICAGH
jgi:hypothetical protein